jgi:hypothetical protein
MEAEPSKDFSVAFGKEARAFEYQDPEGHITFTFDIGSKFELGHKNSICLEHHGPHTVRTPRYHLDFERTKRYLQSCGYDVEIWGS